MGNWTTRGYANSRTANSRTRYLADWSTRRLDNSRTSQLANWTSLLSSFFFPRLISAVADWMSAIFPHMVWP